MPRGNKYKKTWNILKSKKIDERLKYLDEGPTNSTTGSYVQTPGFYSSNTVSPDLDVPGAITSVNPDDQELSGTDIFDIVTKNNQLDLTADDPQQNGQDTSGLFYEDGTTRALLPPGDTTAILGPMMSMWYAWGNFTQIGYVRQADRKMVNLARITGPIETWDGESGFTSYGSLTIDQAKWFKDQSRADYRAFYPGPPSNPADSFGRYLGSIITASKDAVLDYLNKIWNSSINDFLDASSIFSLLLGTDDSKLYDAFLNTPLGKAGEVFIGYLTNQLPDEIGNEFLGQDYVDMAFEDMKLGYDKDGKPISIVGDNILGSAQNPTYNPETNQIEVNFNYDFDTNAEQMAKDPEKYNYKPGMNRLAMNIAAILGGNYGLDSIPVPLAGWATQLSKSLGGAKQTPGKITMSPAELQQKNPTLYNQLVARGDFPADAVNKPSQSQKASKGGNKPDPKSMLNSLKNSAPPEIKMAIDPSMDNFNKLSPKAQSEIMDNMKKNFMKNYDGSNFKGSDLKGIRDLIKGRGQEAAKNVKFEKGYMITTNQTATGPVTQKIPLFQQKNNESRGKLLTESRRKSILKNVKKPVPQLPDNKIKYKSSGRDLKGNKIIGKGLMPEPDAVKHFNPAKQTPSVWGKGQKDKNIRSSQEKKNAVLELVGECDHVWEKVIEKNQRGFNESKKRIEEENEKISEMVSNEMQKEYEKYMIKERKVDKLIDFVRKFDYEGKPATAGYPNDPPPETVNGYHPDLLEPDKKANYYNGLDPQTARAMPKTASKAIDAKVREAARKAKIKGERRPNTPNK